MDTVIDKTIREFVTGMVAGASIVVVVASIVLVHHYFASTRKSETKPR